MDWGVFSYTVVFDECSESVGAGMAVSLFRDADVDVIIGPTCNFPALSASTLASYYDVPIYEWGLVTSPDLRDADRLPTTITLTIDTFSMTMALRAMFREFGWDEFVFIFTSDGDEQKCESMKDDIQSMAAISTDIIMSYTYQIPYVTDASLRVALREISTRGRIFVSCFPDNRGFKRSYMLAAHDLDLIEDDYVYIFIDTKSKGFVVPSETGGLQYIWQGSDGRDNDALKAFKSVFFIADNMGAPEVETDAYKQFSKDVIRRMADPPFLCTTDCKGPNYTTMAPYTTQLYEAFYAYALVVNQTLTDDPNGNIRSGSLILVNSEMNFTSVDGNMVQLNANGTRVPTVFLIGMNTSQVPQIFAKISVNDTDLVTYTPMYTDEKMIWASRGGVRPKAVPDCGFSGKECPVDFVQTYLVYVLVAAFIVLLALICIIFGIFYTINQRRKEIERQNLLWQLPFTQLKVISKKGKGEASFRSLQSGPSSTSTKLTVESRSETQHFIFYTYENEIVVAMKHEERVQLDSTDSAEMRQLRILEHDNLNRFIGMCLDGPQLLSIWKFCARGSLADVIQKSSVRMDNIFVFSLLKDIVNGLAYIHSSFLQFHGKLTSRCCLVDDRWQVKVAYYELLWTAPELLRSDASEGTAEGDIYSFGIICSELITRATVFDLDNRKETPEELIYLVKKGGHQPIRPALHIDESIEINPALLHLVRDCWAERASERPPVDIVKSSLRSMTDSRNDNLMDHVFNMLESYASTLEGEVEERTKELVEEKKKSDVLLYRMLPRQVAEKLKLGQTVQPETFESVTLFFSDVVSFTKLAGRCTPLQVVNLLNDLYTVFDSIIDAHDVETIGDGYLCVSGLPRRNGNDHTRQIASMSLAFMESLENFRVPHLPAERINLRIGIHCGSVVAGVVGLTMPRYCLFGDAVNTASRMESNGKPGQIHVSSEANHMLTEVLGGFETRSRGEVIIKGKGVMETFWLISMNGGSGTAPVKSILREEHKNDAAAEQRSVTPDLEELPKSTKKVAVDDDGIYASYRRQATLKEL
ncbi:unnamed protein product [Caenorhabditis auriculariae]|uniref:Guanylate cyclase n=1 Tax=Caenorhabditis auriculariae TaxID=2777116 RepID=A0A8S1HVI6_9PELO|nr:unnamed protein product [Caenorhabditis auriculariae]